ncbi:YciI family protein [Nocardioides sp.]|uniref:YciI family protein n=1 Tax=Nocardioides sp. TaxID=35761 RepID=UPI003784194E
MTLYLFSVHGSAATYEVPIEEMQPRFDATARFNETAREAGIWVFAGGLERPDTATTVDGTGGAPVVTDGPYLETKEWIGGFWVFEIPDLDEALEWAAKASAACGETVEVRPFQGEA